MATRLEPSERKKMILEVALKVAEKRGFNAMTRCDIAAAAGISHALVNKYFSTMSQLRKSVMKSAVKTGFLPVIAQGLILKDTAALKASNSLKKAALNYLLKG